MNSKTNFLDDVLSTLDGIDGRGEEEEQAYEEQKAFAENYLIEKAEEAYQEFKESAERRTRRTYTGIDAARRKAKEIASRPPVLIKEPSEPRVRVVGLGRSLINGSD